MSVQYNQQSGSVQYNSPSAYYLQKIEEEKKKIEELKQRLLAEYLEAQKEKKDVILLLSKKKQLEEELAKLAELIEEKSTDIEEYNKQVEELKEYVKNYLERELGVKVEGDPIEYLKEFLGVLEKKKEEITGYAAELKKYTSTLEQLNVIAKKLLPKIIEYNREAEELEKLRDILADKKITNEEAQWLAAHGYKYMNVNKLIEEYNKRVEKLEEERREAEEAYKQLQDIESKLSEIYDKYKEKYSVYKKMVGEYKEKYEKIAPLLSEYNKRVEELRALAPHVENIKENMDKLLSEYNEKKSVYEELVGRLEKEYSEYLAEAKDVEEVGKELEKTVKNVNMWVASYNIYQFFNAGKQLFEDLNKVLKGIPGLLSSFRVEKEEIRIPVEKEDVEEQLEIEVPPPAPKPVININFADRPLMDVEFEALSDIRLPPGLSEEEAMLRGTEGWLEARKVVYEMQSAHKLSKLANELVGQGISYEDLRERLREKQGELEAEYNKRLEEDFERAKESIINYQVYKTVPQVRAFIQSTLNYLSPANILATGLHFLGLDKIEYKIAEHIAWSPKEGGPVSAGVEARWPAKEGGPVAFTDEDLARLESQREEKQRKDEAPDIALYRAMGEWWKQHTFVHEYTREEVEKTNELVAKYTSTIYYPAMQLERASQWLFERAQEKLQSNNPADWLLADIALRTLAATKFAKGAYSAVASLATPWTIGLGVSQLYFKPKETLEYYAKNPFNIYELAGSIVGGYYLGKYLFSDRTPRRGYAELEPHKVDILWKKTETWYGTRYTQWIAREEGIIRNFDSLTSLDDIVGEASTKISYGKVGEIEFAIKQLTGYKLAGSKVLFKMTRDVDNVYDVLALRSPGKVEYIGKPPKGVTNTIVRDLEIITIGSKSVQGTRSTGILRAQWGWRLFPYPKPVLKYSIDYYTRMWQSYESPYFMGGIARTIPQILQIGRERVSQVTVPSLSQVTVPPITSITQTLGLLGSLPREENKTKTNQTKKGLEGIHAPELDLSLTISRNISLQLPRPGSITVPELSLRLPELSERVFVHEVEIEVRKQREKTVTIHENVVEQAFYPKLSLNVVRFSLFIPKLVSEYGLKNTFLSLSKPEIAKLKLVSLRKPKLKLSSMAKLKLESFSFTAPSLREESFELLKPVEVELLRLDTYNMQVEDAGQLEKTSLAELEKMQLEEIASTPEYRLSTQKARPYKPRQRGGKKRRGKKKTRGGLKYWTRSWKISPLVSFKKSKKVKAL